MSKKIHLWILGHSVKTETGSVLDFKDHLFLYDFYNDESQKIVCYKAAQIGFTTAAILKTFYLARYKHIDIIYTLPTVNDIRDFVSGKVNRIIANNPVLASYIKDKDAVEQKKVDKNVIYYRGCFDEQTEVLTNSGWKKFNEIKIGEKLPALNINNYKIEQDSVSNISKFKVDEEVISLENRGISALLTKEHRCVVSDRKGKLKIKKAFEINQHSLIPSTWQTEKQKENTFNEILGWVITEGSYWQENCKNRYVKKSGDITKKSWCYDRVSIIQKKYAKEVRNLLKKTNISFYEKKHGECIRFELSRNDSARIRKIIPDKKLSFELINSLKKTELFSLFKGLMMGDGSKRWNEFYQSDEYTSSAFQYLCVLLGKASAIYQRRFTDKDNRFSKKPLFTVGIRKTKNLTKIKKSVVSYKGIMWCPTTANGTVFARRNGKVYITGQTWTEKAAIMVSSDLNVHDEEDRSNQQVIDMYSSRMQHSKYRMEWHFSNPSIEGNGVSKYWGKSDQKHWFVKCEHCNKRQYLSWPDSINTNKRIFICKKCGKELTREDRRCGEWIQKYKNKEWSGYWISLLQAPWVTAENIIEQYETKGEEFFYNFVLGLPHTTVGSSLGEEDFFKNITPEVNLQNNVIIGVDTGIKKHYVCGNEDGIFYYGVSDDYKEIEKLMAKFKNAVIVIDHLPDITGPRMLREKYPGRVYLCHYSADRRTLQMVRWGAHEEEGNVVADRNRIIQIIVDEFRDGRIKVNGTRHEWNKYYEHWKTMYRITEPDALGVPKHKWESSNGQDHWCHATVYWRVGMNRFGSGKAELFNNDNIINLPKAPEVEDGGYRADNVIGYKWGVDND